MIELGFEDTYFQDIKDGKKTVIGKIDADLPGIKKGGTVIFFKDVGNKANSSEKIIVKVKDIHKFSDVLSMLKEMKLKTILPRSKTYKDGEKVFEETYGNRLKDAKFTAFTFDILNNSIKVPKGSVLRVSINSNSKEPIINFQPENEAELHMQERHERLNRNAPGPQVKRKKNGESSNGPQVKRKKNGEPNGPNVKNKKNNKQNEVENEEENEEEENNEENSSNGPQVKNKKNGDSSNGPQVKRKKNGDSSNGPRVKNKKNGDNSSNGPRVKNKKNGDRPPREFELTTSEPWLSLIENGQKTVEGRLFKGIVEEFRVNDTIRFFNKMNGKEKSVTAKITKLTKYSNFGDLLFNEKLYKVLPGLPNIKCGILVYSKLYKNSTFNEIKQFGTLAIELAVV
jgi:ASC-1-like (ASCH) protein